MRWPVTGASRLRQAACTFVTRFQAGREVVRHQLIRRARVPGAAGRLRIEASRGAESAHMKYTIDEDPVALKFALLRLPDKFIDGDRLPILPTDRWFDSREEAVAALPELFNREE